jgi:hypothetical protein
MHDIPYLTREQILWILNGLPEAPGAVSHIDVKKMIHGACASTPDLMNRIADLDIFIEEVFDHLLTVKWMVAAPEFPTDTKGRLYYYRKGPQCQMAIDSRLIARNCRWV